MLGLNSFILSDSVCSLIRNLTKMHLCHVRTAKAQCMHRSCTKDLFARRYTLRKHAHSKYIKNFTTKNRKLSDKNSDIFHISAQNIDCGGGSNEYTQTIFFEQK